MGQAQLQMFDESGSAPPELQIDERAVALFCAGGGKICENFITEVEEQSLLQAIDNATWIADLRRRVQHYGYRYDYKMKSINAESRIGALPDWVAALCARLADYFARKPDQLIINEYEPGQGIAAHIDKDCFGPVIAAISLGSDCLIGIKRPDGDDFEVVVKRRSLMIYAGDSRHKWQHTIAPRKTDQQQGQKIARGRRVSLTFRTIDC